MQTRIIFTVFALSLAQVSSADKFVCPKKCTCDSAVVACKLNHYYSKDFQNIPKNFKLIIQSSRQVSFPDNSLPRVTELEIISSGSEICDLAWNKSADHLETLQLDGVQLRNTLKSLKILKALRLLKINHAELLGVDHRKWQMHFDQKSPLKFLFMFWTDLSLMTDMTLPKSVESVKLDDCNLTKIPKQFSDLNNLQSLSLENNKIQTLENLPKNVHILMLHGNQISEIKNIPPNTSQLDLSNNNITHIQNIPETVHLFYLSGNNIPSITEKSFKPNSHLAELALAGNKHKNLTIAKTAFKNTPRLHLIDLRATDFAAPLEAFTRLKSLTQLLVSPQYNAFCDRLNKIFSSKVCSTRTSTYKFALVSYVN
ncbi:leucine-rich repeat-containing protein 49-like [Physella acuta]|uniref:leucine-rich repeat-containing protein 49-like n=1 Tax=Physella acuta TaxID=109671 RepID=UPI0027DBFE46|nr:leucine-rich repeat-containing protein 49-like [Physella acuta]